MYSNSRCQSILKQRLHSCWNLFPFPDSPAIRFQRFWLPQTWRKGGPNHFGFRQHCGWQVQIVWASVDTPADRSDSFFLVKTMSTAGLTVRTCLRECFRNVKHIGCRYLILHNYASKKKRAEKVPYGIFFAARPGKTFSQVRRQIFSGRAVKTY